MFNNKLGSKIKLQSNDSYKQYSNKINYTSQKIIFYIFTLTFILFLHHTPKEYSQIYFKTNTEIINYTSI